MKFWKILFLNSLILGSLISISSISWFSMWMGLEINLLSIIPLISNMKNIFSSESALKYFIIQTLASILLLFSVILLMMFNEFIFLNYKNFLILILNSALLTKMGAAPFHFWFPEIIEGMTWFNSFLMLTWQKIAPMVLLMYNSKMINFLMMVILISMIISAIMSLNQISIRKILVFSSINHLGWMLSILIFNKSMWLIYFLVYSFILINLVYIFWYFNSFFFSQLFLIFNKNKILKMFFYMNFFSLGGLPPFLGFFSKWIVMNELLQNSFYLTYLMIFFSLIMLFTYSRLFLNSLMMKNLEILFFDYKNKISMFFILINLMSLMFFPLIFNFM